MSGPGIPEGVETYAAVSLLDLYPTLIDYAGLGPPGHTLDGLSLRRHIDGSPVSDVVKLLWDEQDERYEAYKSEEWTYIVNTTLNSEALYDKTFDPNEWDNLADDPQYDDVKSWLVPEPDVGTGLLLGALAICLVQARMNRARGSME
jgi:arylsulfatase A-like enzyme